MAKRKVKARRRAKRVRAMPVTAPATVTGTDDENLTEKMIVAEYGFGLSWLRKKRQKGSAGTHDAGPPFYKFGDSVRYRRGDVREYIASRKVDRAKNALQPQPVAAT